MLMNSGLLELTPRNGRGWMGPMAANPERCGTAAGNDGLRGLALHFMDHSMRGQLRCGTRDSGKSSLIVAYQRVASYSCTCGCEPSSNAGQLCG